MLRGRTFLILCLISGFTAAWCLPVSSKDAILLVVKAPSGQTLAEVTVYDRSNGYQQTSQSGELRLSKPGKVIFLKHAGYRPQVLLTKGLTGRVEVILEDEAASERLIPVCARDGKGRQAVWGRLRAAVPASAVVENSSDHDYVGQAIFYDKDRRHWLSGIDGPNATYGFPPDDWILSARSFSVRSWWPVGAASQGIDFRGQSTDGKYWRFFGTFGTAVSYHGASKEAAVFFDKILDSVCFQKQYWD